MTSEPTPAVALHHVAKAYGSIRAVDGLDLSLGAGAVIALLGPNGSGKSTTINMLLGLLQPDAGEIRLYGRPAAQAVRLGLVGAMLQHGAYPNSAKVREVLHLARRLYPQPMPIDEVVAIAQLDGLVGRRVDRLSGGQLQRVRFAFAIAGHPRLLVLDEPTVGLDVEARTHFWRCIRDYRTGDRTVLFSTHYLEEADANADRIVVLAGGRVLVDGSGTDIKKHVASRTVGFRLGDDPSAGLDALPGVTGVTIRDGRALLRTTDSDATVSALLASRGPVRDLELAGGSLEEAFVALTGSTRSSGAR